MKKTTTAWDYTNMCAHCGCNLHTKKEYEQGQCKRCQGQYEEEMHARREMMREQTREWYVRSESILNTFYTVTRNSAGAYSCTCPDFQFRGYVCKHINKVKMAIAGKKQKNKLPEVK